MKISKIYILSFVWTLSQLGFIFSYVIPNQQIAITKSDPSSEIPLRIRVKSSQIEFQKITEPFNNHTNNNNLYLYKQINGSVYLIVSANNGHLKIVDYLDSNKSHKSIGTNMLEYFIPDAFKRSLVKSYNLKNDLTFSGSPGKFVSEPVSFEVKVLIVTDETILEHFSKDSADKPTAFSNMKIYYTELINSVNHLFKSDSKTKISIKIADFLFLEFIHDLFWLANFIVGDSTPFYKGKEVINSKKALHAFKHYMSKRTSDVDYNLAIGFTNKFLTKS
ncbi:hypothetical protein BpHYR1_040348 [Brachionus plicatilis]|uniref:Uncharacterized protein n=1 Tax=Brachionus plicatilis TaxID=10195 RepID=A0A3M7PW27_BRAPC|nr:hypothetical protein BpHYR1_040348 [Brachionus plicatilis]